MSASPRTHRATLFARRRLRFEPLEQRALLSAGSIVLGPTDGIAMDQPRVQVQLVDDGQVLGPGISPLYSYSQEFLLDTGANSVLFMQSATLGVMESGLFETEGEFVEAGVAGAHHMNISAPYQFDFAGTSGVIHTIEDTRVLSDPSNDFGILGPWGLAGMPAMADRVTTLDMSGWADIWDPVGGLDNLFMKTKFSDAPAYTGHQYVLEVDNEITFDPMVQITEGENPPVWSDIPFLNATVSFGDQTASGTFLFDTGAQMSILSTALGIEIGLDSNGDGVLDPLDSNYVETFSVGGVGGSVDAHLFALDEVRLPTRKLLANGELGDEVVDLVWNNLQWLIIDIGVGEGRTLAGVLGSELLTSGWFGKFESPDAPDGYFNNVQFDFRDWGLGTQTPGSQTGRIIYDLNPDLDQVVYSGNTAPTAVNDVASTNEYTPVTIDVLANDSDADGDPLTVTQVTNVEHGTAVIQPDGTVLFTPEAGFVGAASFSYTIADTDGEEAVADVQIDVVATTGAYVDDAGVLWIRGSDASDRVRIMGSGADGVTVLAAFLPGGRATFGGLTAMDISLEGGNDSLYILSRADIPTTVHAGDGDDYVQAGRQTTVFGGEGNDRLYAQYAATLDGEGGNDRITGSREDDILIGGDGNDYIQSGSGDDLLLGGSGNDSLFGTQGDNLLRGGLGDDRLYGGTGSDILLGEDGRDVLYGRGDRDLLIGGDGSDTLDGGAGSDIVIDGTTSYDEDNAALIAIRDYWRSGESFDDRTAGLESGVGSPPIKITPLTRQDDEDRDRVFGDPMEDWILWYDAPE